MAMKIPSYLHIGDCIGIVAPARSISKDELKPAIDFLLQNGFRVTLGTSIFAKDHQFAGTDTERAADFQSMLDDPEIKAIICARGGYGSVRIIDKLDFTHFEENPKWICGYSDVTVFHSHLNRMGIATLHCTMPVNIKPETFDSLNNRSLIQGLTGGMLAYSVTPSPFNRKGTVRAEVVGGNLSILYSLLASRSDIYTKGKILFIEDLDEYLYHIDRMMMALKRAGHLEQLAGLIVGSMSDMNDNAIPFGKDAEQIIHDVCAEYDFPVCYGFPAGHTCHNVARRLGMEVTLSVTEGGTTVMCG